MKTMTGDYYEIIEGTPLGWHGCYRWDFGFSFPGHAPLYFRVTADHPDGPEGYRHAHWEGARDIQSGFIYSLEDAQQAVARWTPERRRKYLTKNPLYWHMSKWCEQKGWMTPEGRRKYRRVLAKDGRFAAALALTDGDFRHGITLDILYQLQIYTIFGRSYGAPEATPETRAAVEAAIAFLSGPDIPQPVAAYFKAEQQNFSALARQAEG